MKLPKIQEDEFPLKNTYCNAIISKPIKTYKSSKLAFDWQSAEINLIKLIPQDEQISQKLIQLQNICKQFDITHFYSYFFVASTLNKHIKSKQSQQTQKGVTQKIKSQMILTINNENQDIKNRRSKWHRILQVIQLRQNLVSRIDNQVANDRLQTVHNYLDDIRFINFQIIKKIQQWSSANKYQSQFHPFFMYEGNNYLVKIINDNTNVINTLNSKSVKFLSPPNPFYLSRDGNKSSMSQTQQQQIDKCMEILASQKAQQLKIMLNPPVFLSRNITDSGSINTKKLRNQLNLEKAQQIKSIYKKLSQSNFSVNLRSSTYSTDKMKIQSIQKPNLIKTKTNFSVGKIDSYEGRKYPKQLKQAKQTKEIKQLKDREKQTSKYLSKIELLKKSVEHNKLLQQELNNKISQGQTKQSKAENLMRLSTISNKSQSKLPKTVAQIKAPKPKIRLIMQRQSIVEDVVKTMLPAANIQMYNSMSARKTKTSFFKQQKTNQQQNAIADIKPITQHSRTISANNSKTSIGFPKKLLSKQKSKQDINRSKQRSFDQKTDLNLSDVKISPQKIKKQQQSRQQRIEDTQSELRTLNSKLRQQTIMSIYGKKMRVSMSPTNSHAIQNSDKQRRKTQIQQQLKAVKNRLKDLASNKPFDRKRSSQIGINYSKDKKNKSIEKSLVDREQEIKMQNKDNQQQLQSKQRQKQKLLNNLKQKDQRIEQLLQALKKQSVTQNQPQHDQELQIQKNKKLQAIDELKYKIKGQNLRIKQQMEQEQRKFILLKQKQYELKQQQMAKKFELDMQQMKEEYIKKNQDLQKQIMQQQKIRKQNQIKILHEQRQMEELKMQMEQRLLKEQLLQQILKEHKQKQNRQEEMQNQSNLKNKQKIKRQIIEKQQIERKVLQNIEQDNKKLAQMFQAMKRKNEETEMENRKKLLQLKLIQQETRKQQQNLKKLQEELEEAKLVLQQPKQNQQQQQVYSQNQSSLQQIRLRVKQQILKQMIAKKTEKEYEQKAEQEERAKKLAQMQEEIRNQLKRQQEQMQRIEIQQRQKYQRIKKQMEDEHKAKMEAIQQGIKQQEEAHKKQMSKQIQKSSSQKISQTQAKKELKQTKNQYIQNGLAIKNVNQKSFTQNQQKQTKNNQQHHQQLQNKQKQENEMIKKTQKQELMDKDNLRQDAAQKQRNQDIQHIQKQKVDKNQSILQNTKIQKSNESANLIQSHNSIINNNQKNQQINASKTSEYNQLNKEKTVQNKKIEQQQQSIIKSVDKKQTQSIKQPTDEILTKYQNLQQHLAKCKQIFISDRQFQQFLTTFYNSFAIQVKEMLPYNYEEILKILTVQNKKIDIFQTPSGHSIGWMDEQKYVLIGQMSCIENIVRKYGQVQIQMTYIFNKTNPYQKQFLAKYVKIFDKVGFIFQKKLKQQNMYSIKLIIKVPKQIIQKNFKTPSNRFSIKTRIAVDLIGKAEQKLQNKRYSYEYLLSQTLKHCLSSQEQIQFKEDKSEQAKLIERKIHYKVYHDQVFKSQQIDDKKLKVDLSFNIKFNQNQTQFCYNLKGVQYINDSNNALNKIYVSKINKNLSIIIFLYDKSYEQMSLDLLLNIKTSKIQKQRQLDLYLPIWRKKQQVKINTIGPKQFQFYYEVDANYAFGSIINTDVLKQQYKFIQPPFVFSVFQTNDNGLMLRSLLGQIVESKDLLTQKK